MAPLEPTSAELELQLKDTIQDLYQIMVQVTTYNTNTSPPSATALTESVQALSSSLQRVHRTAQAGAPLGPDLPGPLPKIPPELVQYVENGRNPDIYTREFVELVRRGNQLVKGKMNAFAQFRDVLAEHVESAMPECKEDVKMVLDSARAVGSGKPGN
ncbi:Mediator of RNA polymerase II transcription subunit 10 [Colletotrichum sidae]|uniref:Mediator of RNA polymerase II transcription subunit 10 n=4 Tax=Colletotrichum orbiculare species complex TaxID=2707354 RepID=A0A484G317_COLOR|nr:Mediator of RNA polymerase II transcription subunit 10 [Colletotrichum orbiculare MAFF 240422]TDZ36315.1 Mediator of RNA polymerase II transcription subunit 10 [Colletotrichum spinosum]TDZ51809.1 Mediator of RNA polymerase II transcription subunit 10 [Colletotrichum trifolii]TEA16731.1 Mediator of RNA polymerase II transcription subunit 10 [Colletotrichum sidae]